MTIHTKKIFRLRSVVETTFGTDQTASMTGFEPLDFTNAQLSYDLPRQSPNIMQQKMDSASQRVSLLKRAALTVTCNLTGQTGRAGNGSTHTQTEQGKLLYSYLGGQRLGQGDLVAASSTATVVELDAIARWEAGAALAVLGTDGRLLARRIVDVVGGDATVFPPLTSNVPADNATAYAAAGYYLGPSSSADAGNTSLQFVAEGLATDDRWLLLGGKVTKIAFTFASGQIVSVTYTIQFVDWKYGANATTDLTADTAPLTYDAATNNGLPLVVEDSDFYVSIGGVTGTAVLLHASSVSIDCAAQWVPVSSTSGINGVVGWARNQNPEVVTGSFTIPLESRIYFNARDAEDEDSWIDIAFQIGSDSDVFGCALIYVKAQITNVQPVEVDGLSYQKIDFVGGVPIITDTTDIDDSPFSIHLF